MATLESLFPWLCVAVLLLTVAGLAVRSRSTVWLSDTHLNMIAQPRVNTVLGVGVLTGAVIAALLGIGFLAGGRTYGWGFFALSAEGLFLVAFYVWAARRALGAER